MSKSKFETNLSPRKLKCNQCVYKTKNKSDLRRHERRHNDVKFPCDICNMPFMTFGHLGAHKRMVHGISTVPRNDRPEFRRFCSQCDYTTWYSSDMAKHRRKHVTNQFPCPVCNYPLGNTTTLKIHMKKYHDNHQIIKEDYNNKRQSAQSETSCRQNAYSERISRKRNNRKDTTNDDEKYSGRLCTEFKKRNEFHATSRNNSDGSLHRGKSAGMHGRSLSCPIERHRNTETNDRQPADEVEKSKRDDDRKERQLGSTCKKSHPIHKCANKTPTKPRKIVDKQIFSKHTSYHSSALASQFLSCKHCEFRTVDVEAFRRHCERHEKGKFRCRYCAMPFLFSTNLERHLERKHMNSDESSDSSFDSASLNSPNLLKCISCRFVTYSYNQLNSHVKLHDTDDDVKSKPNTERVNKESETDSNSEFNFDDDYPGEQFSFEDTETLDTFSDGKLDTDDRSLSMEEPISKTSAEYVNEEDKLASKSDLKLENDHPDLHCSLEDRSSDADCYVGSSVTMEGQQSDTGKEEYYCTHCNYVTLDKKFIRLHMTMHGFPLRQVKNTSSMRTSKKNNLRGYNTKIVKRNYSFRVSGIGNAKNVKFETKKLTATGKELSNEKDIADTADESKSTSQNEFCNVASEFESSKENSSFRVKSVPETNDIDTDLVDASESMSSSSESSTDSTKSSIRNAVGGLTKQEFMQSRKFYKIEPRNGAYEYECRICMTDNIFTSYVDLCRHFKNMHEDIQRQICVTCKYCNAPFPKAD